MVLQSEGPMVQVEERRKAAACCKRKYETMKCGVVVVSSEYLWYIYMRLVIRDHQTSTTMVVRRGTTTNRPCLLYRIEHHPRNSRIVTPRHRQYLPSVPPRKAQGRRPLALTELKIHNPLWDYSILLVAARRL